MQEDIENKVVVLIEHCSKLTASELRRALEKVLAQAKSGHSQKQTKEAHGKMTVKELAAKDKGMQSIEVTDSNIGSFNRVARKYGIDFAPFKVKGENRYLVFFKAPDGLYRVHPAAGSAGIQALHPAKAGAFQGSHQAAHEGKGAA